MKALSIKQPWASLIAHGIKDIENRTWATKFRGTIYIHASGKSAGELNQLLTDDQYAMLPNHAFLSDNYPKSAVIGTVDIVDCVINHHSIWAESTETSAGHVIDHIVYNWVLANPVLFDEPILNVKGKLSLWEFDGKEAKP